MGRHAKMGCLGIWVQCWPCLLLPGIVIKKKLPFLESLLLLGVRMERWKKGPMERRPLRRWWKSPHEKWWILLPWEQTWRASLEEPSYESFLEFLNLPGHQIPHLWNGNNYNYREKILIVLVTFIEHFTLGTTAKPFPKIFLKRLNGSHN